ncbi:MAG: DUF2953 domain-containing protein [Bacillaceae bacterium]|nr:DUF2953 domain-containing protein [Bacillaceae bacterium]
MHWYWWLMIIVLTLLMAVPFLRLKINLSYLHDKDNDDLKIKVTTLFGLLKFRFEVPLIAIDKESPSIVIKEEHHSGLGDSENTSKVTAKDVTKGIEKVKDFLEHIVGFHKIGKNFLKKVKVHHFSWNTVLGIGDAAHTAVLTGVVWGLKGTILGIISNYMLLKVRPEIHVQPHFQLVTSHTELTCMFSFRLGNAILAALQVIKHWKSSQNPSQDLYEQNGINS